LIDVKIMVYITRGGVHDPQLNLAAGQIVGIIDQRKIIGLLSGRIRKILGVCCDVGPCGRVVIVLLQLNIMRRVAVIPGFKIHHQVGLDNGILLAKGEIIDKCRRGVDFGQYQLGAVVRVSVGQLARRYGPGGQRQ